VDVCAEVDVKGLVDLSSEVESHSDDEGSYSELEVGSLLADVCTEVGDLLVEEVEEEDVDEDLDEDVGEDVGEDVDEDVDEDFDEDVGVDVGVNVGVDEDVWTLDVGGNATTLLTGVDVGPEA